MFGISPKKNPNENIPYGQLVGQLEEFYNLLIDPINFIPKQKPGSQKNGSIIDDQSENNILIKNNSLLVRSNFVTNQINSILLKQFHEKLKGFVDITKNLIIGRSRDLGIGRFLVRLSMIDGFEWLKEFKIEEDLEDNSLDKICATLAEVVSKKIETLIETKEIFLNINSNKKQLDFEKIVDNQRTSARLDARKIFNKNIVAAENSDDLETIKKKQETKKLAEQTANIFDEAVEFLFENLYKEIKTTVKTNTGIELNLSDEKTHSTILDIQAETLTSISTKKTPTLSNEQENRVNEYAVKTVTDFIVTINNLEKKSEAIRQLNEINFYNSNEKAKITKIASGENEIENQKFFSILVDSHDKQNSESFKENYEEQKTFTLQSESAPEIKNIQDTISKIKNIDLERFNLSHLKNKHYAPLEKAALSIKETEEIITNFIKKGQQLFFIPDHLVSRLQTSHREAVESFKELKNNFEDEHENLKIFEENEKSNLYTRLKAEKSNLEKYINDKESELKTIILQEGTRFDSNKNDSTKIYIEKLQEGIENLKALLNTIINAITENKILHELRGFIKEQIGYTIESDFLSQDSHLGELKTKIKESISLWENEHVRLERQQLEKVNGEITKFLQPINNLEKTLATQKELLNDPLYATLDPTEINNNLSSIESSLTTIRETTFSTLNAEHPSGEKNKFLYTQKVNLIELNKLYNETLLNYEKQKLLLKITSRIDELNIATSDRHLPNLSKQSVDFIKKLELIKSSLEASAGKSLKERMGTFEICKKQYQPIAEKITELYKQDQLPKSPSWNFGSMFNSLLGTESKNVQPSPKREQSSPQPGNNNNN